MRKHVHESVPLLFSNSLEERGPEKVWHPGEWRLHHCLHTFSWAYPFLFLEQSRRVWFRRSVTPWWMTFASSFAHILMSLSLYFSRTISKSVAQEECDTLVYVVCTIVWTYSWVYLFTFLEQSRRVWPRRSATPWWRRCVSQCPFPLAPPSQTPSPSRSGIRPVRISVLAMKCLLLPLNLSFYVFYSI